MTFQGRQHQPSPPKTMLFKPRAISMSNAIRERHQATGPDVCAIQLTTLNLNKRFAIALQAQNKTLTETGTNTLAKSNIQL